MYIEQFSIMAPTLCLELQWGIASRAGCCPCPPTSAFTFIHGDSFGGAMCGYQDDVDQDFGDLQQKLSDFDISFLILVS